MSEAIKDTGGPAFPCTNDQFTSGSPQHGDASPGMTLRDWFAGQALAGLLAANATYGGTERRDLVTADAFAHADAMIAERNKP